MNILMLASFSKPVDSEEIRPYVSAVLSDLKIDEQAAINHPLPHIRFYIDQIITEQNIRANIHELFDLCLHYDHDFGLTPFYLLHYAWEDLETESFSFYYEGANLDNIGGLARDEAKKWNEKYILGK